MTRTKPKTKRARPIIRLPECSEENFIEDLKYRDPIGKASIWLHKQFIKIITEIGKVKDWYAGSGAERPEVLLSSMFAVPSNTLCDRFRYYGEQLSLYSPGHVPRDIVETDYHCARIMVARLYWCCHDVALVKRLKNAIEGLWGLVGDGEGVDAESYAEELDERIADVVRAFGSLSEYFEVCEYRLEHPESAAADPIAGLNEKAGRLLEVATDTNATVRRMDERDKRARRKSRMTFDVETQEGVFQLWETGRRNPAVRQLAKRGVKVGYDVVFEYYRRDFKTFGIMNADMLRACLGARSDRLCRTNAA